MASPGSRSERRITHDGRTQSLAEWARELGLSLSIVYQRSARGLSDAEILRPPVQRRPVRHQRTITLDPADYALQREAAVHALEPSWTEWARHVLNLAACDELGLDPLDRTPLPQTSKAPQATRAHGAKR